MHRSNSHVAQLSQLSLKTVNKSANESAAAIDSKHELVPFVVVLETQLCLEPY